MPNSDSKKAEESNSTKMLNVNLNPNETYVYQVLKRNISKGVPISQVKSEEMRASGSMIAEKLFTAPNNAQVHIKYSETEKNSTDDTNDEPEDTNEGSSNRMAEAMEPSNDTNSSPIEISQEKTEESFNKPEEETSTLVNAFELLNSLNTKDYNDDIDHPTARGQSLSKEGNNVTETISNKEGHSLPEPKLLNNTEGDNPSNKGNNITETMSGDGGSSSFKSGATNGPVDQSTFVANNTVVHGKDGQTVLVSNNTGTNNITVVTYNIVKGSDGKTTNKTEVKTITGGGNNITDAMLGKGGKSLAEILNKTEGINITEIMSGEGGNSLLKSKVVNGTAGQIISITNSSTISTVFTHGNNTKGNSCELINLM